MNRHSDTKQATPSAQQEAKMKKCNKCGAEKPLSDFHRGYVCKACRALSQLNRKKARREEDRQKALHEAKTRSSVEWKVAQGIALPRTFSYSDNYVPESNFYQRNNGNKHIQSRGV